MTKSFAQNFRYFRANFFWQTFALFLRMKRNEFCAIFCVTFTKSYKKFKLRDQNYNKIEIRECETWQYFNHIK